MQFTKVDFVRIAKLSAAKRGKPGIVAWLESDDNHKVDFDFVLAVDGIELAHVDSQWIAVVSMQSDGSPFLTVDIDEPGRTAYILFGDLILKVAADPSDSSRSAFFTLDVGTSSYAALVASFNEIGISSETMMASDTYRTLICAHSGWPRFGNVFFIPARNIASPFGLGQNARMTRASLRHRFDLLGVDVGAVICLSDYTNESTWAMCMDSVEIYTLSVVRWAQAHAFCVVDVLNCMVAGSISIRDLICVHRALRSFQADSFVDVPASSFIEERLWNASKRVLIARQDAYPSASFDSYISVITEEVRHRMRQESQSDEELARTFDMLLGTQPTSNPDRSSPDAPVLTRESLREAMRAFQRNRWGGPVSSESASARSTRGVSASGTPAIDDSMFDNILFGRESAPIPPIDGQTGDPLHPVSDRTTDPISFGTGYESPSVSPNGLAANGQSGIDPNCERSMMLSPLANNSEE